MSGWLTAVRRALSVDGGAQGVPMLLALVDERDGAVRPDATDEDGVRIAALLEECRAEVAPSARDDDLGIVTTILATVAHHDSEHGS